MQCHQSPLPAHAKSGNCFENCLTIAWLRKVKRTLVHDARGKALKRRHAVSQAAEMPVRTAPFIAREMHAIGRESQKVSHNPQSNTPTIGLPPAAVGLLAHSDSCGVLQRFGNLSPISIKRCAYLNMPPH